MNAGLAKVSVTGGSVSAKGGAIQAINYEAGSVKIDTSAGVTLTSTHGHGIHAELTDVGNTEGTVTVTSAARIYAGEEGISIGNGGAGAVTVTSSGAITADDHGIYVQDWGSAGVVTVANSGAIASDARGIYVEDWNSAGAVTVTSSGAIVADSDGIFARTTDAGVSITHSAGAIAAEGLGIRAYVGTFRQEADTMHADYVAPENKGLAKVAVTGGSVESKGTAVEAINYEAGSVEVTVSAGVTLTSTAGRGIHAGLTDAGNPGGTLSVTQAGMISAAKNGINAIRGGGAGAVTVTNSGAIEAGVHGIFVVARGAGGTVTVTNSGAIGKANARARRRHFRLARRRGHQRRRHGRQQRRHHGDGLRHSGPGERPGRRERECRRHRHPFGRGHRRRLGRTHRGDDARRHTGRQTWPLGRGRRMAVGDRRQPRQLCRAREHGPRQGRRHRRVDHLEGQRRRGDELRGRLGRDRHLRGRRADLHPRPRH